jgi:hypothetical protein
MKAYRELRDEWTFSCSGHFNPGRMAMDGRPCGLQNWSEHGGEEKNPFFCHESPWSSSLEPATYWLII